MPWYEGSSLLYHLEHLHIASDRNLIDNRFPVQWVIRPMTDTHHDYRGYAGQIASGVFKPGDDVLVLPSERETRIRQIDTFEGPVEEAFPPMSCTILLEDEVDVSRGDMISRPHNRPTAAREFDAMVCWMSDRQLNPRGRYAINQTTRRPRRPGSDCLVHGPPLVRQVDDRLDARGAPRACGPARLHDGWGQLAPRTQRGPRLRGG